MQSRRLKFSHGNSRRMSFFCPKFSPQAVLPRGTFINITAGSYTLKSRTAIIFSSRDSFAGDSFSAGSFTLKSFTAMIFWPRDRFVEGSFAFALKSLTAIILSSRHSFTGGSLAAGSFALKVSPLRFFRHATVLQEAVSPREVSP